jgi:carbon-monoxide dehydrogenase large subunit
MGAEVKRREDPRLLRGMGSYVADIKISGLHTVAFVRSPYAHADIVSIDTTIARSLPGVVAIVTGHDLPAICQPMPMAAGGEGGGAVVPDDHTHYALSLDRVRHVGEAVAAVIATSPAAAADAAAAVVVEWAPLPTVSTPEQALAPDAPRLFASASSNIDHVWTRIDGNVDTAFAQADRIVRQRMVNQRLSGVPMEARGVLAMPDPTTNGLTIWTSAQAAHLNRTNLAKVLPLGENQIRVICPDVGGGFGVKIYSYPEEILLAALALHYQLPLRWIESRMEHLVATAHGRAQVAEYEAAVKHDGTITGLRIRITADIGAYPVDPAIPDLTGEMAVGVYQIPAVDIAITCVYTNTTPTAAYRGAGRPEAAYYIERLIDRVAAELQLDPAQVRHVNFIPPAAFPYTTPTGKIYDSGEYARALDKALTLANYTDLRAEQARRIATPSAPLLGIGLATYVEMCGFGPYESATVRVEPNGTVTVLTGISPHGQGTATTFAQIVADQLGAQFEEIIVKWGDTAQTPMGQGTMGSRSLAIGGGALVKAVEKVREKARQIAAHMLEAAPDDIEFADGGYRVRGVPDQALSLSAIAKRAYSDDLPDEIDSGLEVTDFFRPAELIYPFGAHVAVVEIERETGEVRVLQYYTVDDCGPRISPTLVAGQVHGGLAQGIGQALFEEIVYDENGQLLSGSLMDYALPRADAFPTFVLDKTETPTPLNPLGVKGIGEAATVGSTPAIANAVADALQHRGVYHVDIPLRAEKIWRALIGSR